MGDSLSNRVLTVTDNLPIRHAGKKPSNGKVRSGYWFPDDVNRVLADKYDIHPRAHLGAIVISDRITAFDVAWTAEEGLEGVPSKGASLNAISAYWFQRFSQEGLGDHHIVDIPHPLVWIVQKAEPVMIEVIARQYITGSMWRDYSKDGTREFGDVIVPNDLQQHQRLEHLLITPTTKGKIEGVNGIPSGEDAPINSRIIRSHYQTFGLRSPDELETVYDMLESGFDVVARKLSRSGQMFVDTKIEVGYMLTREGRRVLGYIDEVGTPDSSRIWDEAEYAEGRVVEKSKEGIRQYLIGRFGEAMTKKGPEAEAEKARIAAATRVPVEEFMKVSETYKGIAQTITGKPVPNIERPREEILDALAPYGLVK